MDIIFGYFQAKFIPGAILHFDDGQHSKYSDPPATHTREDLISL
jgi:hypothetical protein